MPFDEFVNNFDQVQICHLGPETALAGVRIVDPLPTISIQSNYNTHPKLKCALLEWIYRNFYEKLNFSFHSDSISGKYDESAENFLWWLSLIFFTFFAFGPSYAWRE